MDGNGFVDNRFIQKKYIGIHPTDHMKSWYRQNTDLDMLRDANHSSAEDE